MFFYLVSKNKIKIIQLQLFILKSFSITRKPAYAHSGKHEKKPFDVIRCLYKTKQSHWLLCITRNFDWSRKITPLSNLIQMASRGLKTYSESRIELQNRQMLKEVLEKSTRRCGPKSLNVSLNIAGVERIRSENVRLRSTLDAIWFEFKWKEGYRQWKFVSSVVSDSQISLTWYRRHLMAAIQLATSCGELHFSRCCALKRTGTFAS